MDSNILPGHFDIEKVRQETQISAIRERPGTVDTMGFFVMIFYAILERLCEELALSET